MTLGLRLKIDYYVGGAIHLLIKPLVVLFGAVMRRDHRLDQVRDIAVLKLLGGGSLLTAYPSLLALKERAAPGHFRLVTLSGTRHFAELLGLFDEIIIIRDQRVGSLLVDSFVAIRRLWRCDALIDLEVHSRLSTIFCLLTCARNRIGFYTQESFWRRSLATHLLFFHQGSHVNYFYEQVVKLFGRTAPPLSVAAKHFQQSLGLDRELQSEVDRELAIAPFCSELARERMISFSEWVQVLRNRIKARGTPNQIHLLGGPSEQNKLENLRSVLLEALPELTISIHAAGETLRDRIGILWRAGELISIDSALMHVVQLLEIRSISYWGPSSPRVQLDVLDPALHETYVAVLPCSPCVHLTAEPPCHGNNICMRLAVNPEAPVDRNPPWLAQDWKQDPKQVERQTQLAHLPTEPSANATPSP